MPSTEYSVSGIHEGVLCWRKFLTLNHYYSVLRTIALFLSFWTIALLLQSLSGSFAAPFGAYPDEPSHYLSGLLIYDWLHAGGPAQAFASNYYLHLPYFAIGYWPPLFYWLEAAWMTLFGVGRPALLVLIAGISALWSATFFHLLKPRIGTWPAAALGLAFLLFPAVEWSNRLVMTDTFYGLLCLWALVALGRFIDRPTWRACLTFGVLGGCALLAKNNSIFVLLTAALIPWFSNRRNLYRRPSFYAACFIPLAIWAPWLWIARSYLAMGIAGVARPSLPQLAGQIGAESFLQLTTLLVPMVMGWRKLSRSNPTGMTFALAPLCFLAFLAATRVPILPRYLIPACGLLLLSAGHGWTRAAWPAVAAFALLSVVQYEPRSANNIRPVVDFVTAHADPSDGSVLVPTGQEGGFIAEFARKDRIRPVRVCVRPRKLLIDTNWHSGFYRLKYETPLEVEAALSSIPLRFAILDRASTLPHDELLAAALQSPDWRLIRDGPYALYERMGPLSAWTPQSLERAAGRDHAPVLGFLENRESAQVRMRE